jgi:ABC-type transporter lipoprotein component MlaA
MDQAHYQQQVQWYEDEAFAWYDQFEAWQNVTHLINPFTGQETWRAETSTLVTDVYSYAAYLSQKAWSQGHWYAAVTNLNDFEDRTTVCP